MSKSWVFKSQITFKRAEHALNHEDKKDYNEDIENIIQFKEIVSSCNWKVLLKRDGKIG